MTTVVKMVGEIGSLDNNEEIRADIKLGDSEIHFLLKWDQFICLIYKLNI